MKSEHKSLHFANPHAQYLAMKDYIDQAISRVLDSESYILGQEVSLFEEEFSKFVGRKYTIGVNSGTDALILSMRAMNIGSGDEVIAPAFTAVATVAAISAVGATPVLIDINPKTYTIEVSELEKVRSVRTKAVVAVHLYGHPAEMEAISNWCIQNSIELIEDCAQAHGAKWLSRNVGTWGKVGCFSFYPTKNLGGIGDGGAIVTNDERLHSKLVQLRQYGWNKVRESEFKSQVSRLDEIQAAILRAKLGYLAELNESRIRIARIYSENLDSKKFQIPHVAKSARHVFHLYVIRVSDRNNLLDKVQKRGIYPGIHYGLPIHWNKAYAELGRNSRSLLVESETASTEVISLPMYPELLDSDIFRTIEILNQTK
jgi:dTDP-4-amino-4,6-dideoxygalactose transaminase